MVHTAQTVNAFYSSTFNEIVFPAAIRSRRSSTPRRPGGEHAPSRGDRHEWAASTTRK